ncbi:MAG: hypothetical protein COA38_19780 [Fluviicola sp.]|nr:MAG: hypothetical protein COA38_19780 [Fluviicola sp.]
MNKFFLIFISITISTGSFCQENNSLCASENLKDAVMDILRNLDSNNLEAFSEPSILLELYNKIIPKDSNEPTNDQLRLFIEDKMNEQQIDELKSIISGGIEHDIFWENITYEEFLYELKYKDGFKLINGYLYFSQDQKLFRINVSAIFFKGKYQIMELNQLSNQQEIR